MSTTFLTFKYNFVPEINLREKYHFLQQRLFREVGALKLCDPFILFFQIMKKCGHKIPVMTL